MLVGVGGEVVFKFKVELKKCFLEGEEDILCVNFN